MIDNEAEVFSRATRVKALTGVWLLALGAVVLPLGEGWVLLPAAFPLFPIGLLSLWSTRTGLGSGLFVWVLYALLGYTFLRVSDRRTAFVVLAVLAALLTLNVIGCHQMDFTL